MADRSPARPEREMLISFALWISNVWENDNEDDRAEAERAVNEFLSSAPRVSNATMGAEG